MKEKTLKIGQKYYLNELKINSIAEVVELKNNNTLLKRRLLDLGLTKGVKLQVKKIAPLGDPVSFELRGYELGLRREELKSILVRLIK